jgi:hypothetical protein
MKMPIIQEKTIPDQQKGTRGAGAFFVIGLDFSALYPC